MRGTTKCYSFSIVCLRRDLYFSEYFKQIGGCMSSSVSKIAWDAIPMEKLSSNIGRKMVSGEKVMIAQVFLDKGAIVPKHQHHNEQITYILTGVLRFWIGDDQMEVVDVYAGEVLHIPSNVWHKAEALEDTLDVDVFSPPRQDWLDKTDAYLRGKG